MRRVLSSVENFWSWNSPTSSLKFGISAHGLQLLCPGRSSSTTPVSAHSVPPAGSTRTQILSAAPQHVHGSAVSAAVVAEVLVIGHAHLRRDLEVEEVAVRTPQVDVEIGERHDVTVR